MTKKDIKTTKCECSREACIIINAVMRPPFHSWDLQPKPYKRWMPMEKEKIQCTTLKSSGLWTVCSAQNFTVHCRGGWSILVVLHCMKIWRNTESLLDSAGFTALCHLLSPSCPCHLLRKLFVLMSFFELEEFKSSWNFWFTAGF